jgi:hypothetical protein
MDVTATGGGVVVYDFAILALLALAVVKVVDFVCELLGRSGLRSPLTFVAGVGVALLLDYSMFAGWDVAIRDADMGTWVTGFAIAGMTVPWRALFSWLSGDRATRDETLGEHVPLRRAA